MAEGISSKLKSLFKSNKDEDRVQPKIRGVPVDKEEFGKWVDTLKFADLPPRGQEAFFKCLRDNYYQEDEDIIHVKPEHLTPIARRYQFWVKTKTMDVGNLFDVYICDEENHIEDVSTFFTKFKDREDVKDKSQMEFLEEKKCSAHILEKFILQLREEMEDDLKEAFSGRFKKYLKDVYGENGEKI